MGTRLVPFAALTSPAGINCGSISMRIDGINVSSVGSYCPFWIQYTPAHYEPVSRDGWELVAPPALLEITCTLYSCESDYFLWIFPVGQTCRPYATIESGHVESWTSQKCPANGGQGS